MKQNAEITVTVCCLCYNQKSTVSRMIDSVLAQKTDFPFEIIIHDDASTDGTKEIVESYAQKYPEKIIPILQTENQYSKLKNTELFIIPYVRGKYLAFCEGDDYWCDDEKLQRQVGVLESMPSCSFAVHNVLKKNAKNGKDLGSFPPVPLVEGCLRSEDYIMQEIGNSNWMFQISSVLIRSEVMKQYNAEFQNGYFRKFMAGDFPLIMYALTKGDAYYINRNMSVYSVDSGGFMSYLKRNREFAIRVHQSHIDGLEEYDSYTQNKYHVYIQKAILRRRFEILVCKRDFRTLLSDPIYSDILKEHNIIKRGIYRVFAMFPAIQAIIDRIREHD